MVGTDRRLLRGVAEHAPQCSATSMTLDDATEPPAAACLWVLCARRVYARTAVAPPASPAPLRVASDRAGRVADRPWLTSCGGGDV